MRIFRTLLFFLITAGFMIGGQLAEGHFIWIISHGPSAKILFGEGLEPDQAEFLTGLKDIKVYRLEDGRLLPLTVEKKTDGELGWFEVANANQHPLFATCDYGVFGRGEKSMRLNYSAKCLKLDSQIEWMPVPELPLDLVPELHGTELKVTAYFQGKVDSGVEITVENGSDGQPITKVSGDDGRASFEIKTDTTLKIRGKQVVVEAGEVAGKKYDEHRFYCTLVLQASDHPSTSPAEPATEKPATEKLAAATAKSSGSLPALPIAITSFGGTRLDDHLYVFGGQMGEAHAYADEWQNGTLYGIDLKSENPQWEALDKGMGFQGLALLAHRNRLLHLGGFQAKNKVGEPHDLVSSDDFRAFNLETKKWESLPPLPQPRSSFDACLFGDVVYVVGGWTLKGKETSEWSTDAYKIDLSEKEPAWKPIASPPFKRRALGVIQHSDKIFAIGGIDADGKTSNRVDYFDLKKDTWIQATDLPSTGALKGFGCCALIHNNQLVVSTADGAFWSYNDQSGEWGKFSTAMEPSRFFHRAFSISDSAVLAVGGANMEIGKFQDVLQLPLKAVDSK